MKPAGPLRITDTLDKLQDVPYLGTTVPGNIPPFILTDFLEIRILVL